MGSVLAVALQKAGRISAGGRLPGFDSAVQLSSMALVIWRPTKWLSCPAIWKWSLPLDRMARTRAQRNFSVMLRETFGQWGAAGGEIGLQALDLIEQVELLLAGSVYSPATLRH